MNVSVFQHAYLRSIETRIQPEETTLNVVNALRFIIQNVFANMANTFVITISSHKGPAEIWLHDLISKLFATWGFTAVQLVVLDHKTQQLDVPGKRYCNLIMTDSYLSLNKANIVDYNRNSDGLENYFIFLQTPDNVTALGEMRKIFKYCFDNYWINCNVMLQNLRGEILIYTYFPFKANNCLQTQPELVNRFVGDRFVNDIMFPDKLLNLHECPLKLSTWESAPFVINATNKDVPSISVSGFEIVALITISQQMNFTLDIEWIPTNMYHKDETSKPEPFTKLKNFQTNITMGCFRRTANTDKIATPTYGTYYIPIAAIIMRRQVQHISMDILTFPFDTTTWVLIIVFYGCIGRAYKFREHTTKVGAFGFFEIYKIFIGVPILRMPKKISKRIRLTTILLTSFILRSIYQSLLFYLFRANFYQIPPTTLDSLVSAGYSAVSTELTKEFLLYVPQIEDKSLPLIAMNTTNEMYTLDYVHRYSNQNYVAMSIVEFAIRYVQEYMAAGEALQTLPIYIKNQQIGFYLSKHSYLSRRFDYYILHFHQAGLLNKWREWTNSNYQVATKPSSTVYENALMISLKQLAGFLILTVVLLSISTITFGLELLSQKHTWMQIVFK